MVADRRALLGGIESSRPWVNPRGRKPGSRPGAADGTAPSRQSSNVPDDSEAESVVAVVEFEAEALR